MFSWFNGLPIWSNDLDSTDYQLLIQCESQTSASFAGIAFQIEDSSGLGDLDAINGAIAVVRDNATNDLTDVSIEMERPC